MKDALADFKEGTGRKAVELTGRLLAENPRMMDIWELRSLALTRLGRMDESLEALKRAQELAPPGSTHYLRAIASQCLERGLVDEAVKHAQAAKSLGDELRRRDPLPRSPRPRGSDRGRDRGADVPRRKGQRESRASPPRPNPAEAGRPARGARPDRPCGAFGRSRAPSGRPAPPAWRRPRPVEPPPGGGGGIP